MTTQHRRAFTLVELLVVIAIISIFVGMMLPAVQASREGARRTTCRSHLAQLGAALGDHESAHGALPPGTIEPNGPVRNVSQGRHAGWLVHLLPYIDEGPTFKHLDLSASVYDAKNAPVAAVRIGMFVCPSEDTRWPQNVNISSYAGCQHDVEAPIDENNHGVLFRNSRVRLKDVTDGLAHTIFLGEKRVAADDLGWLSGTRATLRNTGTPINKTQEENAAELAVGGFGSRHTGGAHFLFGDGAVRFLNNEIDAGLFQQLGHRADGKLLTGGPTREE